MTVPFKPHKGLIVVTVRLVGPAGASFAELALDTGASRSLVNAGKLASIGCYASPQTERAPVTTASGVEYVPLVPVAEFSVLGRERQGFPVICHTLPPSAGVDGLLGLDFFRGLYLAIDFQQGLITLE